LALPESDLHALRQGAYLHDIGKVGIPDRILFKDGPLSEDEWSVMRRHVLIGEQICSPMRSLRGVLPIVRYHHERWDGSGYCEGLIGDDIPYLARVFQICDCWDALTSVRPYKQALTPAEAIQVLWGEVAKGWRDPELVKRFEAFAGVPVMIEARKVD
jgi:putative two-component system response regulator